MIIIDFLFRLLLISIITAVKYQAPSEKIL